MSKPDFKVIVCGSRGFEDYDTLKAFCDKILFDKTRTHKLTVISGAARGADKLGEKYANEKGYACEVYPADWDKYGRSAGMRRNEEMLQRADGVIAFSVNKSAGTENMIKIAKDAGKKVAVRREG